MTADVQALYQAVILDHNKRPRNFRALDGGRRAEGDNPLCGDHVIVYVRVDEGIITEATFQGFGCAIARASASLMTDSVKGKTVAEAEDAVPALPSPRHGAARRAGRRSRCAVDARRRPPVSRAGRRARRCRGGRSRPPREARDEVVSTE